MRQFYQAQQLEESDRNGALELHREMMAQKDRTALTHCAECGGEIPEERQAIRGVIRCVPCQQDKELNDKRGL